MRDDRPSPIIGYLAGWLLLLTGIVLSFFVPPNGWHLLATILAFLGAAVIIRVAWVARQRTTWWE